MHERLHRRTSETPVNDRLRQLGARIPRSARPAVLGSVDAAAESRAVLAEQHAAPVTWPTDTRIRRSSAIDRFADTIGAQAFTVGRDVFVRSGQSDERVMRHELAHVHEDESVARPTIRRRGVRSALMAGDERFEEFQASTDSVRELYEVAASDTYSLYKPVKGGGELHYTEGSANAAKGGQRKAKKPGTNPQFVRRAAALQGWSNTAADSAERLYEELRAVRRQFADDEYMDFSMGDDTKLHPDAEVQLPVGIAALESKHVASPAQGAVDGHVKAVTSQLEKRDVSMRGPDYVRWLASITIANAENPWPYTPAVVAKMKKKPTKQQVIAEMTTRAGKYNQSTTRYIQFEVRVDASKYLPVGLYEFEV